MRAQIDAQEARKIAKRPEVRFLDATWFPPWDGRRGARAFVAEHIQGAGFFDIDAIADLDTDLPHNLPAAPAFAEAVGKMGVGMDHSVILYDQNGFLASARAWWMFRAFGFDRVQILNGGIAAWRNCGGETQKGEAARTEPQRFQARLQRHLVWDCNAVHAWLTQAKEKTPARLLIDARPEGRFAGTDPEPWPGRRRGHIPDAKSLPATALIDPNTGLLRARSELVEAFGAVGFCVGEPPPALYCGSGVSAAILALALFEIGEKNAALYDASWAEWGRCADLPAATL